MSLRSFLFLQGVATPFFAKLAAAIQARGHQAFRVNFCGGDRLFQGRQTAWNFSAPLSELADWLRAKHQHYHFTDVVLFGDTRPVHTQALLVCKSLGLRIHVYEEGYLRPDWITLETGGVNGYSSLLNRPATFWEQAGDDSSLPTASRIGKNFYARAWHDIRYRLANQLLAWRYPHYHTHRPFSAYQEYVGWIKRFPLNKLWRERREAGLIQDLVHSARPYYLFPLQLDSDAQIRVHSPFASMQEVIQLVLASFAQHAPAQSLLVIKNHPLDTGILRHADFVRQVASQLGIQARIIFLETGHLPTLLEHTRGTVLVNSTTGTSALHHGSPLIALGTAIFNLPGLTFQHGLARFWTESLPPDRELYRHFRHRVLELTQLNGDFYSRQGMQLAIAASLEALRVEQSSSYGAAPTPVALEPDGIPAYASSLPDTAYRYPES